MDADTRRLIESLHGGRYQYVLAVTGGGAAAVAQLLNVPGGSRTILEALVPYAAGSLAEFLGHEPEQSCSADTARRMARRAFDRAGQLAPHAVVAGVGCTASLVSDRPKRGDHRFHLATHTANGSTVWSLTLDKGARDREGEEAVVDAVLLDALAQTFGTLPRLALPLREGERLVVENHPESAVLARLFAGEVGAVCVLPDGRVTAEAPRPGLLLPGSFNPLHAGHEQLASAASGRLEKPAAFEIGVLNADKPPLVIEEVVRRAQQFAWKAPVWLTRAPTFWQKAELFAGAVFVVGVDTAERLVAPRFYDNSEEQMCQRLAGLRAAGCRFLVAGRVSDGLFQSLDHVAIPPECRDLFEPIPESEFRVDLSSTSLRGG